MTERLRTAGLRGPRAGPFDVRVEARACLAITGPSGSGKSLFLRMIADLDPNHGEAWVDGAARSAMSAPAWRGKVVFCPAEPGFWAERVGDHFSTTPTDLADRFGLRSDIFDAPVADCSTGERQRIGLIRAMARNPPVLLLDEPTGALDADSVRRVEVLLRERMASGMSVVLVTHDPAQADRLGTRRATMAAGQLR